MRFSPIASLQKFLVKVALFQFKGYIDRQLSWKRTVCSPYTLLWPFSEAMRALPSSIHDSFLFEGVRICLLEFNGLAVSFVRYEGLLNAYPKLPHLSSKQLCFCRLVRVCSTSKELESPFGTLPKIHFFHSAVSLPPVRTR